MTATQDSLLTIDFTKVKKISIDLALAGGVKTVKLSPPKDGELVIVEETAEILVRKADETILEQLDTANAISFSVDYKKA